MVDRSEEAGLSFGITSAVITTLGLIVGLNSTTHSHLTVLGGIFIIAIADAFSDALGMHISQESECRYTAQEIWKATISTFVSKFIFAMTFAVPVLLVPGLLDLNTAIIIDVAWGFSLLALFSYRLAKRSKTNPVEVIGEHLLTAILVVIATY
ncbi:MAG: hypothetical protein V1492_02610, partial [Candidatus Micrarchaeota archaeon]